ncbi:zinc/iron-chelating domain-containing protein [Synergistales bacterium]|nr:zinc/iron-chelating domain-containing protein [Synergistales bacterium]
MPSDADIIEPEKPEWWSEGVRFECLGCGRCCGGEPGAIFFTPEEEDRIVNNIEINGSKFTHKEFRALFVTNRWGRPSFKERHNGDCVFFDAQEKKCKIYLLRPAQCALFPFWPSVLESAESWTSEAVRCLGMNDGPLWSADNIRFLLSKSPFEDL